MTLSHPQMLIQMDMSIICTENSPSGMIPIPDKFKKLYISICVGWFSGCFVLGTFLSILSILKKTTLNIVCSHILRVFFCNGNFCSLCKCVTCCFIINSVFSISLSHLRLFTKEHKNLKDKGKA